MTTTKKIAVGIGVLFLIGSLQTWIRSEQILGTRGTVLEAPIQLEEGFSIAGSFTVDMPTEYWIEVECRKPLPPGLLEESLSSELEISYSVVGNGQIAESKSVSVGRLESQDTISGLFGTRLYAVPDQLYHLDFRVVRGVPNAAAIRSSLKVSVDVVEWKKASIGGGIYRLLAQILAVLAFACIGPVIGSWLVARRRMKSSRKC